MADRFVRWPSPTRGWESPHRSCGNLVGPANCERGVARLIDPVVAFNNGVAHRLSLSLATLVVGQTLTSESNMPFEPFTAWFDVGAKVTARSFKAALGFEPTRQAVLSPAARFFESATAATDDPGAQQVYAVLEHVMRRSLRGLTRVFVRGDGVVEVPFFVFGRLASGPLVGVRSISIET